MSEIDELRARIEILEAQVQGSVSLAAQIAALTNQVRELTTQVTTMKQVLDALLIGHADHTSKLDVLIDGQAEIRAWIQRQA